MSQFSRRLTSAPFQRSLFGLYGRLFVIAFGMLTGLPSPAVGQIIDWDAIAGGAYATAGNWSPANVPNTAGETAQFDLAGLYRVTFNANSSTTIDDLLISDGDVTFSNAGSVNDATLNISDDAILDGGDLTLAQFLTTADVNLNITDLLFVGGGTEFSVFNGATVTAGRLDAGATSSGDGTLIVDDAGSRLVVAQGVRLGRNASTGTLTFQSGSTDNTIGGLTELIGGSGSVGSTGRLNVLSGATLQTASIRIGNSFSSTAVQEGTLTVNGANSLLTMTGASTLTIGDETNPNIVADVIVSSGGQLDTGTGGILIQNSGDLRVDGGTFNANGLITMGSGTRLSLFSDAAINANAGLDNSAEGTLELYDGTLTVTNGAFVPNAGGPSDDYSIDGLTPADMPHLVIGAGATANIGRDLRVGNNNNGEMTVSGGGSVSNRSSVVGDNPDSNGTVTVDGDGSTWTHSMTLNVGFMGNGTLTVQNGGAVSNGSGHIGLGFGSTGTVTVDGEGSAWAISDRLLIGGSLNFVGGTGILNVQNSGLVDVAGTLKIWNTSTLRVIDGTLNTGGLLTMESGSTLSLFSDGSINANAGLDNSAGGTLELYDGTLTVTNGAFVPNAGGPTDDYSIDGLTPADMPHLEIGAGATADIGRDLFVGDTNSGEMTVSGGGTVSNRFGIIGGNPGSNGTVTVDGDGSRWTNAQIPLTGGLDVGLSGNGTLNVQNGGAVSSRSGRIGTNPGSIGTVMVDDSTWTIGIGNSLTVGVSGSGTLNIQNGGVVSTAYGYIGRESNSIGIVTVNDVGSAWTNSRDLFVGGSSVAAGGTGTLNVQNSGLVEVNDTFKLWTDGTLNLAGGTLELNGPLEDGGGTFYFTSGVMNVNDATQTLVAGSSGNTVGGLVLGSSFALGAGKTLNLAGNARVDLGGQLTLGGGTLTGPSLLVQVGGFVVNTAGSSTVTSPVLALAGSSINVTGGVLTIGDATAVNGFYSNGSMSVADGSMLALTDANDAVLDSGALVTLGNGTVGTLAAANGLTLDFGGNITGFGIVNTPDNSTRPTIINGNITGNSFANPITFTGYVKGVGTFDNVDFVGTFAPGFSPAAVNMGSVSYAASNTLEIEIGGLNPGSDFDQLNHVLGAGVADLSGTLDISLTDGFTPIAGDTFEIITAASVLGVFDTVNLPALPGDLLWFVNYGATSVELVSTYGADFDEDGDVDDLDLAAWEGGFGNTLATHMTGDANANALANGFDFLAWQRQFSVGGVASLAAAATIPEPSSLLLAAFCLLALSSRWKCA